MATWFPIVPVGTKIAASRPNICGGLLLQQIDRRILAVNVVPNLGRSHRRPHRSGGPRDRIAAQIDYARWPQIRSDPIPQVLQKTCLTLNFWQPA